MEDGPSKGGIGGTEHSAAILGERLDELVTTGRLPGVTAAVILPDGRTIRGARGLADLQEGTPMPEGARMFSGSTGKMLVATLVMKLKAEGRLALSDPVSAYLGADGWFDRLPNAEALTVRHLLTHTGGLPDHVSKEGLWAQVKAEPDRPWTDAEKVALILDDPSVCAPDECFSYADTNYILLGMMVERMLDQSWYDAARLLIMEPCGMADTTPAVGRRHDGLVPGYGERMASLGFGGQTVIGGRYFFEPGLEGAGGGLITTPSDLAGFTRCLTSGALLPEESVRRMSDPVALETGLPDEAGYGMGLIVWDTPLGRSFGHSGFVPGFNTSVEIYPDLGVAAALQTNTDASTAKLGRTLHMEIVDIVRALEER